MIHELFTNAYVCAVQLTTGAEQFSERRLSKPHAPAADQLRGKVHRGLLPATERHHGTQVIGLSFINDCDHDCDYGCDCDHDCDYDCDLDRGVIANGLIVSCRAIK